MLCGVVVVVVVVMVVVVVCVCVCVCARVRVCEHPSFKSENSDKSISLAEPNFWHMQASVNNIKDRKFSDLGIADRVEAVR